MNVAFRVDASAQIGSGHFMRCLSLADALRRRGATIRFVSHRLPTHALQMLIDRAYDAAEIDGTADAEETASALAGSTFDWLVVDHYALDASWESKLRQQARHILAIDDLADRPHDCDVLLDQNLHPDMDGRYTGKVPRSCLMLLGPRYALLREEFQRARPQTSARTGPAARVLVSFGGADAQNHTAHAIEALLASGADLSVDVVIGTQHAHQHDIESACRRHRFQCHVQTRRMAELMAAADLAIGAGGITTWERCCMGVPSLVLSVAANQHAVVDEAARQGLLYAAGSASLDVPALALHLKALLDNTALREMMSRNGLGAVDGRGVERVARVLDRESIRVREATIEDARALFDWRNDESVRTASRQPDPIAWPEHQRWLRTVLSDDDRVLLIGERNGAPVGVVRFDVSRPQAEVSIYRVPRSPEAGLGLSLLLAAEAWLRARRPDVANITAHVLGDNERSHHLFRSTGYQLHSVRYTKPLRVS